MSAADARPDAPLVVDGGVTVSVDTASVRRLGTVLGSVAIDVMAAHREVAAAMLRAQPQIVTTALLSPQSAAAMLAAFWEVASLAGALAGAWAQLGLEVWQVCRAYDEVEERAVALLRLDVGYGLVTASVAALYAPRHAEVGPMQVLPDRPAPNGLRDLAGWVEPRKDDGPGGPGRVDVIEREFIVGGERRHAYTVILPGTSSWAAPGAEDGISDPRNLSANLRLAANLSTAELAALPAALEAAGVPEKARVTFVGHSQGGMTALAAANHPGVRAAYDVERVITFGSPVARMPVPHDVRVLSVENRSDLVPSVDLAPNQATRGHITVQVGGADTDPSGFSEHGMTAYADAARQIDASDHASLVDFRRELREAGVLAPEGAGEGDRVRVRRVELALTILPPPEGMPSLDWPITEGTR
ncbi:MAG: hypothetical protein IPI32_07720 [Austwickia sp.]|nr:hypothetical protein [Austwickia sp.]MBK9102298.1 hypothetical protein [Austwickia sp.]